MTVESTLVVLWPCVYKNDSASDEVAGRILSMAKQTGNVSLSPQTILGPSNPIILVTVLHLSPGVLASASRLKHIQSPTAYLPGTGADFLSVRLATFLEQSNSANAFLHANLVCVKR